MKCRDGCKASRARIHLAANNTINLEDNIGDAALNFDITHYLCS